MLDIDVHGVYNGGMKTELDKLIAETQAWNRTYAEIMAALRGNRVAISNNWKEVERLRKREQEE